MKKIIINIAAVAVAIVSLASCNDISKMTEAADRIKIQCNPEVLEAVAGNIDAQVSVTFPEEYFLPKAILEITPVIIYSGGEVAGKPFVYQGEKIAENYKTVTEEGATITEKVHFDFIPGMEKSELVGRAKVSYKGKEYEYPHDIKIADGVNTTYMLVCTKGSYDLVPDGYQDVIDEKEEAQILYLINSSNVRSSELSSADIKEFQQALKNLESDSRREVKGTEIVAYASPDGAESLNNKLSADREKSAQKAFNKVAKKLNAGDVTSRSIGEDWEGFKELVEASDVEDKDLIIRVLSMYSDPNVREREIKNMSSVYSSLARNVLPQLRRARFITNVEYTNYTAEELEDLVANNIDVLDEPALLRAAANAKDPATKIAIYKQAIKKFGSEKAKINAAVAYLNDEKVAEAKSMIAGLANDDVVNNIKGVIAMREGNNNEAAAYFAASNCPNAKANQAALDILNGKYVDAAAKLAGTGDKNEALAYILTNQLDKAAAADKCKCERSSYLNAIIAARQGNVDAAKSYIEAASAKEKFAERAQKDVEFAKIR
ncbi:MAG: hypothetical protein KBT00_04965 [Bacteroidales bacterium]|nr:hypothetical protein [Candidatus Cacconaster merdequi]